MCFFINDVRMFYVKEFEYKIFFSFNIIKYTNYFFSVFFSVGIFCKVSCRRWNMLECNCLKFKSRDNNGRNNESVGARESQEF
jgi:hypothetical protein